MRLYRTFPYQVGLSLLAWPTLIFLHLHWSGYGLTGYLWFMDWLRPVMASVPGLNSYNVPDGCGLLICGYPLTWIMHGVGLLLVGLTANLAFKDLNPWKEGMLTSLVIWVAIIWEWWELATGVTILKPELFSTIEQATTEAMRLLNDTVNDILFGGIFLMCYMIAVVLLDRHFKFTYT